MGVFSRMSVMVKSKVNAILDRNENPIEQLDYAYEKQQEMVRKVKQGLIEVATSKRRLQLQAETVRSKIPKLDEQARRAVELGKEDLARAALQRKQAALVELEGLEQQLADAEAEQEKLTVAAQRLQDKVEIFRSQKETMKARYTAAEAQARISESFSGVSEEMADVGIIMDRAQQKTERLRARGQAIEELAETGVLDDVTSNMDRVDRELAQLTASQNVEAELDALRKQVGSGQQRPQLGSGAS
jgi:phage shock protein A